MNSRDVLVKMEYNEETDCITTSLGIRTVRCSKLINHQLANRKLDECFVSGYSTQGVLINHDILAMILIIDS
jgi:hypothetical protein